MDRNFDFRIRYWGTTGTIATPLTPDAVQDKVVDSVLRLLQLGRLRDLPADADRESIARIVEATVPLESRSTFGGNTTCIEIETPDALFMLDAGSGARALGQLLLREQADCQPDPESGADDECGPDHECGPDPESGPGSACGSNRRREAHVLLTHAHMDHTFGTPFFEPYYDRRNRFHLWGSRSTLDSLRAILDLGAPLGQVYFPTTFEMMRGIDSLHTITAGQSWSIGKTRISTLALNHPGGCLGYKLQRGTRSIVVASDHEPTEVPDPELCRFSQGADLLYADAQYLLAEYEGRQGIAGQPGFSRAGWGHGTVEGVVATGIAADVRRLHLGHHEPLRGDRQLAELERYAQRLGNEQLALQGRPASNCQVVLAREGLTLEI